MVFPERIETERLVLRRPVEQDRDAFATVWADPDVWVSLRPGEPFDPLFSSERFDHHLEHWERHGFGLWAAVPTPGAEIAGVIGASHPDFAPEVADAVEIGWSLRRDWWGRGFATEGARAAIAAAFDHLGVDEVISLVHPTNARSIAVAERHGMEHARDVHHAGIGDDLRVYALARRGRG